MRDYDQDPPSPWPSVLRIVPWVLLALLLLEMPSVMSALLGAHVAPVVQEDPVQEAPSMMMLEDPDSVLAPPRSKLPQDDPTINEEFRAGIVPSTETLA